MKKYFYSIGTDKLGPFSFEELTSENLTRESLIWFEGLDDWKPAKDIEELNEVFKLIPPPITKNKLLVKSENSRISLNHIGNYILTIVIGCIYVNIVKKTSPSDFSPFIVETLGALLLPLIIAGAISFFNKKNFSKVLVWTTLITIILAAIGSLSN